jgi:hypothetical protein
MFVAGVHPEYWVYLGIQFFIIKFKSLYGN